ncbi:MAG TPA: hypothetical protein VFN97_13515 [Actinospica sp.]|nr:hypothetical protein [Actinospica sp.]
MPPRRGTPAARALTVITVCAAAAALPLGVAEAASGTQAPDSVVSITDCGGGLTVTVGGGSLVGINLPGDDDCPTDSATATPPATTPPATATATVTASATSSALPVCTLPPPPTTPAVTRAAVISTPAKPPPTQRAAQPVPTPPAPTPTPAPTPKASTPVALVAPAATTFHTVPFKRMNTVLVIFIVAVVPVSIARIRHRRR